MSVTRCLKLHYLLYLSKPSGNRAVYRTIHQHKPRRILEFGVGNGERAVRMIEVATQDTPADQIDYVGVDCFEARPPVAAPGLTLKNAHRLLRSTGARIRLLPGDPLSVMSGFANRLGIFDLVVISSGQDMGECGRAWFYIPRLIHSSSVVIIEPICGDGRQFSMVSQEEIRSLASAGVGRRAA